MSDKECTPFDCSCGPYEDTQDNYWYTHKLNPSQQYFWWTHEWKRQFKEIHESCKKLGINSYSDDYVQGIIDATSPDLFSKVNNNKSDDWMECFEVPDFLNDPELQKIEMDVDQWLEGARVDS